MRRCLLIHLALMCPCSDKDLTWSKLSSVDFIQVCICVFDYNAGESETGGCMWIMWMWDMPLAAAECASQAIHNRWWNLASRPALWSFPPPAAACFPRTHLCCWPRVVCICVHIWEREGEREGERGRVREKDHVRMSLSLPTSTPPASFHSSICQTWIWKQKNFFIIQPPRAHMATEQRVKGLSYVERPEISHKSTRDYKFSSSPVS